jgi:hypothetical protein
VVLDNHLHLPVRLDPETVKNWSDKQVIRRWTGLLPRSSTACIPLSELAGRLGQSRADSVPSLVRRMEARLRTSSQLVEDVKAIVALLSTAPDRPGITTQDRPLSGQRTPTRKPRN